MRASSEKTASDRDRRKIPVMTGRDEEEKKVMEIEMIR
jgi:hypothetical protein